MKAPRSEDRGKKEKICRRDLWISRNENKSAHADLTWRRRDPRDSAAARAGGDAPSPCGETCSEASQRVSVPASVSAV